MSEPEQLLQKPSTELFAAMHEVGFLATGCGLHRQARRIFISLADMDPTREVPYLGLAVVEMNEGRWKEAVKTIEERALKIKPDSEPALCFLALALNRLGRSSRMESVMSRITGRKGAQEWAIDLAKALLPGSPGGEGRTAVGS